LPQNNHRVPTTSNIPPNPPRKVEPLDLLHLGHPRVIASYLLADDEPTLVDCGPASCLETLEAALTDRGLAVTDLRHLVLTHIHLDHAGAAGALARENPALRVHVSEIGAPHLVDPSRLERSARRLYGDAFDHLWGELAPVPHDAIEIVGDEVLGLEAWPTPGHASHHISYLARDGSCYAGDAAGVRVVPSSYIAPVAPPPDIDLEAWERSLDEIEARAPARLCLPHFGVVEDVGEHLAHMRDRLREWAERVRAGASEEEFVAAAEAELAAAGAGSGSAAAYTQAGPFWQSYQGLKRYWDKQVAQPPSLDLP
jgi:glyoxylase-like metal-dependent hydrolase (beta-lactamase superfamily II)